MRKILISLTLALILPAASFAQNDDWALLRAYSSQNEAVTVRPKAVLLGDSVTEGWFRDDPGFFEKNNFAGRGISGQTTSQILLRMDPDVVSLHPKYVVILCGINDLAWNPGYAPSPSLAVGSVKSMCAIAKANKIKPIVCTLPPSFVCTWRPEATPTLHERVVEFNTLLKEYAAKNHIKVVDYYALFDPGDGKMPAEYSQDSIHPNHAGYEKMEEYLLKFIN